MPTLLRGTCGVEVAVEVEHGVESGVKVEDGVKIRVAVQLPMPASAVQPLLPIALHFQALGVLGELIDTRKRHPRIARP